MRSTLLLVCSVSSMGCHLIVGTGDEAMGRPANGTDADATASGDTSSADGPVDSTVSPDIGQETGGDTESAETRGDLEDTIVEEASVDAALGDGGDGGRSPIGSGNLLWHSASALGLAEIRDGDVRVIDAATTSTVTVWTSVISLSKTNAVLYDRVTGKRAVVTIDRDSAKVTVADQSATPGFTLGAAISSSKILWYAPDTHVRVEEWKDGVLTKIGEATSNDDNQRNFDQLAATHEGKMFFYATGTGKSWVGNWAGTALSGAGCLGVSSGWTQIRAAALGDLFFYKDGRLPGEGDYANHSGLHFLPRTPDAACGSGVATFPPSPSWKEQFDIATVVGHDVLLYRKDGAARLAVFDLDAYFQQVELRTLTTGDPLALPANWLHVAPLE